MAVELSQYFAELLKRLPADHPDRKHLQEMIMANNKYLLQRSPERSLPQLEQFLPETRKTLEAQGFHIYKLTGQSIKDLRESGGLFGTTWHIGNPIEDIQSHPSEVAIHSPEISIRGSNYKSMDDQLFMLKAYSTDLTRKIPGTEAVLGSVADYAELALKHLDKTGEYLFGSSHGFNYARTTSTTSDNNVATIGEFGNIYGLQIHEYPRNRGLDSVWATPLIVPAHK